MRLKNIIQKIKLNLYKANNSFIKIIIGSGGTNYNGWFSTDIDFLNVLDELAWEKFFRENTIDNLLAEHVFEHLKKEECELALTLCYRYLKHGGNIRIAVPDGYHTDLNYLEMVKPKGWGCGSFDHQELYNYKVLSGILINIGFDVNLIEWFDENGNFNQSEMNSQFGYIERAGRHITCNSSSCTKCKLYDRCRKIKYTSLIIDAIKR